MLHRFHREQPLLFLAAALLNTENEDSDGRKDPRENHLNARDEERTRDPVPMTPLVTATTTTTRICVQCPVVRQELLLIQ